MKFKIATLLVLSILITSCKGEQTAKKETIQTPEFTNKGEELVSKMLEKVGDYKTLRSKKDVVYTYTYQTPDGKTDISTEKYIFDGELSYGKYEQHQRTLSDLQGTIEQGYDGKEFWLKHNGEILNDSIALKRVAFNRPTNFYWFTMFQKLMDKGISYEYLGEKTLNEIPYEIVKVSFNFGDSKPTDIYQLYINKNTSLVDQFLFTVADFGAMETPNLMSLEYEDVDGMLFPTKRKYKKSTWEAAFSDSPWVTVNWSNIKFNNGLKTSDFER
ncbi:hypothetical protein CLV90_2098 [Maribacter spongiicola]|uniref:Outer membrane lipoprotein-sorting protein n=1 Tax=Maribacter spongiicola TaxID=1206753 RepID=A0A4R7K4G9_9FLAO|nr:DUF6503 family protein [Maribacter spongiicola]TDT45017.1 hypothetical protein CLV90_2098 [Maribacter spongiicola]